MKIIQKTRPELPPDFQRIYNEHYKNNREGETTGASLSQKMESWMHKKVAEDVKKDIKKFYAYFKKKLYLCRIINLNCIFNEKILRDEEIIGKAGTYTYLLIGDDEKSEAVQMILMK